MPHWTEKLPYVGRLISADKVEVDPSRLQPFLNAIAPYDKASLRSYLGSINWFIPFVPGLGVFAGSLYELMRKDTPFKWTAQHQQLFELIKNRISNPSPLAYPNPALQKVLRTDASRRGIAGVLYQICDNASTEFIAFFSRKLSPAETKYATIELEALAVVWCLERCKQFVIYNLLIYTDHSNLSFLKASQNPRLLRWSLKLNEFDASIIYLPVRTNFLADYMSRAFESSDFSSLNVIQVNVVKVIDTPEVALDDLKNYFLNYLLPVMEKDHTFFRTPLLKC